MSYDKQNGVPKRRPLPGVDTHSPSRWQKEKPTSTVKQSQIVGKLNDYTRNSDLDGTEKSPFEDVVTPVKTFLNSNVTPRSSSRKARAGAASTVWNTTPTGTPTTSGSVLSQKDHIISNGDIQAPSGLGLRVSNSGQRSRTGSMVSNERMSLTSSNVDPVKPKSSMMRMASPETTSKFVHANDIRPVALARSEGERSQDYEHSPDQMQTMTSILPNEESPSLGRTTAPYEHSAKLFYAGDITQARSSPPKPTNESNASRPQLQTIYSENKASSPPRSSSPLREEVLPRKSSVNKPSPRRHTRLISNGGTELRSPESIANGKTDLSRRSSLTSPRLPQNSTHVRFPSVPPSGPSPSRRSSISLSNGVSNQRARTPSIIGVDGALPHSVDPPNINDEPVGAPLHFQPVSPIKNSVNGQSKTDQMNELAANARRERKVLDLEISNSSLLAINRTLEREMRKQSAELRRYRRLSRSGRISIAPSSRSASGKASLFSATDTTYDSDNLVSSSDENEHVSDDLASDNSSISIDSRQSSFTTRAARARFRDPKRIELDLAAHRALLLDSQKTNVLIRRCLAYSEYLLSSGKQALEYHVDVPERKHPARVLIPDEVEDDFLGQGQGLLSPSVDQAAVNPWERSLGSLGNLDSNLETPDDSLLSPHENISALSIDLIEQSQEPERQIDSSLTMEEAGTVPEKETEKMSSSFNLRDQKEMETASLDGLSDGDEELARTWKAADADQSGEETLSSNESESRSTTLTASPERKELTKSPILQPGQPGYRGSMQGFGHYLQAFSIFGLSQKP